MSASDIVWKDMQRMRNPFKLEIGMGPDGKDMQTVRAPFSATLHISRHCAFG